MGTAWRVARVASCTRRLVKKGSRLTKRASGCWRTKVAKAALISGPVLALKTWTCTPIARAAGSRSLNMVSVKIVFAGLISTARRVTAGTSSRRSSSRFAANSALKILIPVRLPPGRARLATRSRLTGSSAMMKDGRDRRACSLGRERRGNSARGDHVDPSVNQFDRQLRQPIELTFGEPIYDRHVLALDVAGVFETLAECAQKFFHRSGRSGIEKPDHRHRRLLRARRERPRGADVRRRPTGGPPNGAARLAVQPRWPRRTNLWRR